MAIIKCEQCQREISDKAKKCIHCGKVFVEEVEDIKCSECDTILSKADEICPNCGCPVEYESKEIKPQSVQVDRINVTSQMKKIIIGIIVAVLVCVGGGTWFKAYSNNKAEQEYVASYNTYIDNLKNAQSLMISGGSDAEYLCNLTQDVWSNAIYEKSSSTTDKYTKTDGKFVDDFNTALMLLFIDSDTTSTVTNIEDNQSDVTAVMKQLQNVPEGLDKCYDTICELNSAYNVLTDLAIDPTGSYTSFSSSKNDAISNFTSCYDKLETQIPEKITEK
ncbi:MAG: zinc ribbon domain-containing protein [Clostridia bacterium]